MSADLSELLRAHEDAREALSRCGVTLKHGVASRIEEARGILGECERALRQSGWSDESLDLSDLRAELFKLQLALDGDADAEDSEVDDADE